MEDMNCKKAAGAVEVGERGGPLETGVVVDHETTHLLPDELILE